MSLARRFLVAHLARALALATAVAVVACGDDGPTDPFTPGAITRVSPDSQSTLAGVAMAGPLIVLVTGRDGAPLADASVAWTVVSGGGSLSATTSTTNAEGEASTTYTPGPAAGKAEVGAQAGPLGVTFTITLTAGPPAAVQKFGSDNPAALKGSTLTLSVKVVDQFGNGISGQTVAWSASGGTAGSATSTTDAGGVASTTYVLGDTPGSYGLTATVAGLAPVTFAITAI